MSKIKEIAWYRKQMETQKAVVTGLGLRLEETVESRDLEREKAILARLAFDLKNEELEYEVECVKSHKETGMKNYPGGKVKQFTILEYDKEKARQWAVEHLHTGILKLDVKKFEGVAKTLTPDFVTITQVPRMTLSKDLSEFLE